MTELRVHADPLESLLERAEEARLCGDYRTGAAFARQGVAVAGTPAGRARALRSLANQQLRLGELEDSVRACRDSISILEELGDDAGICWDQTALAFAYSELGLFEEALDELNRARDLALKCGDRGLLYWVHNRAGVVHSTMGNYHQGNTLLLQALELSTDMDAEARFCILNNLADNAVGLLRAQGSTAQNKAEPILMAALGHAEQALELARAASHPFRTAMSLDNLAMVLGLAGRFPEAFAAVEQSRQLSVERGYRSLELSALLNVARVHRLAGDAEKAIDGLVEVLARVGAVGEKPLMMTAHKELCDAYEQNGDFRRALEHYRSYHEMEQEARSDVAAARARLMTHHFELDHARLEADNARLEAELHRVRSHELELRTVELDRYAHEDSLTGLANRRWADLTVPQLLAAAEQADAPFTIAIADIDRFKGVNDDFGHLIGDEVLRHVAAVLRAGLAEPAFVARLGGEEFVIVLPGAEPDAALARCDTLRTLVSAYDWASVCAGLTVTISMGVAGRGSGDNYRDLLDAADTGLYEAKRTGRDRVVPAAPRTRVLSGS
ncbi:tetratricopeptide repeat-containing diguanylate cyclase [Virgisporangium aurantiacum]|uniref:tetratricopeptide repeat-containing diguanylate cyclase n=1 Tax=Virgisporangium aurantiacum TaxID=175570 RepID=UPI001951D6ED|nr:tetratricopeptide repeat-containing diguanylate cyclase [Virgisporangium aurantiacum]